VADVSRKKSEKNRFVNGTLSAAGHRGDESGLGGDSTCSEYPWAGKETYQIYYADFNFRNTMGTRLELAWERRRGTRERV